MSEVEKTIDRVQNIISKALDCEREILEKFSKINPIIVHKNSDKIYKLNNDRFDMDEKQIELTKIDNEEIVSYIIIMRYELHCIETDKTGNLYLHIKDEYLFNLLKTQMTDKESRF